MMKFEEGGCGLRLEWVELSCDTRVKPLIKDIILVVQYYRLTDTTVCVGWCMGESYRAVEDGWDVTFGWVGRNVWCVMEE